MVADRIREIGVSTYLDGALQSRADVVVTEEPLEIRLGDEALAVVMRTPGHDLELAPGFLLAEGIVTEADDIDAMRHCARGADPDYENVVEVRLSPARAASAEGLLAARRAERSTVTTASCGVCGKRTIESLHTDAPPFEAPPKITFDRVLGQPDRLRAAQDIFERTGGLHAAAVFDARGELLVVREDVGRHNAVDKCVGYLMLRELLPLEGATLMVSGRTSFEIVQKALVARIQTVCAVSAPSSLAVELARASNMALLGFVRGASCNVYSPAPEDLA